MTRALIYGIGLAGDAVAKALHRRGFQLIVADDSPTDEKRNLAGSVGAELVECPSQRAIAALVGAADMVCPAPGVSESHAVIRAAIAAGVPIRTEIDLAYEFEQQRPGGPRPMLAVTGTDGKTTTTLLAAAMVAASGKRVAAVGNTEVPLIGALDTDAEVFVVECSSFRLNWLQHFRAEAAVWLNLAPDHQNWHESMPAYVAAKARLWAHRRATDVAIGFAADPVVLQHLRAVGGITRTFGTSDADYRQIGTDLCGPRGCIAPISAMRRALPHDITNALAAAALVLETDLAAAPAIEHALSEFVHPSHRIEPLGSHDGVAWYNDSKATTPHAAITALRSFDRVVLLAGGRNKGLDLAGLATEHQRVVAVVALGESAADIVSAFAPWCPVATATDMAHAVELAASMASPGDTVLLSPACASFDWYESGGYPARGDDFKRLVAKHFSASVANAVLAGLHGTRSKGSGS